MADEAMEDNHDTNKLIEKFGSLQREICAKLLTMGSIQPSEMVSRIAALERELVDLDNGIIPPRSTKSNISGVQGVLKSDLESRRLTRHFPTSLQLLVGIDSDELLLSPQFDPTGLHSTTNEVHSPMTFNGSNNSIYPIADLDETLKSLDNSPAHPLLTASSSQVTPVTSKSPTTIPFRPTVTPPPVRRPMTSRMSLSSAESAKISASRSGSDESLTAGVIERSGTVAQMEGLPNGTKLFVRKRSMHVNLTALARDGSTQGSLSPLNLIPSRMSAFHRSRLSSDASINSRSSSPSSSSIDSKDDSISGEVQVPSLECSIIEADFSSLVDDCSTSITSTLPPKLSWSFPKRKSSLSVHGISHFCFPSGVALHYLHHNEAASLINSMTDERHILQFTDSNGEATYACCVIVNLALPSPSIEITRALTEVSRRTDAANKLKVKICEFLIRRRRERWNSVAHETISIRTEHTSTSLVATANSQTKTNAGGLWSKLFGSRTRQSLAPTQDALHGRASHVAPSINSPSYKSTTVASDVSSHDERASHGGRSSYSAFMTAFSSPNTHHANDKNDRLIRISSVSPPHRRSSSNLLEQHSPVNAMQNSSHDDIELNSPSSAAVRQSQTLFYDHDSSPVNNEIVLKLQSIWNRRKHKDYDLEAETLSNHSKFVIISRRAYCIVTKEPLHAKTFQVLQAMADAERHASIEAIQSITSSSIANQSNESYSHSPDHFEKKRRKYLEAVSSHLITGHPSTRKSNVWSCYTNITRNNRTRSKKEKDLSYERKTDRLFIAGYVDLHLHQDPSIYPLLKEWTAAVLLTYLSPTIIIKLLNLLLVEKSIIIYGKQGRPGVVTAVSLAVKALISPFRWEGCFIPLVPDDVRELFDAPVPFIAGTITAPKMPDTLSNAAVLVLDEMVSPSSSPAMAWNATITMTTTTTNATISHDDAQSQHPSSDGKIDYMAWFLYLPELTADMPVPEYLESKLGIFRQRLLHSMRRRQRELAAKSKTDVLETDNDIKNRTLKNILSSNNVLSGVVTTGRNITPDIYFTSQMTAEEREIIGGFLDIIHKNNFTVCGDVTTPAAWKKYIKVNYSTGELSFQPHLFLEPIRSRMEWVDAVANTQHFMSYVETQQVEYLAEEQRLKIFIRDWILFRWWKRKNGKQGEKAN